jgi:MFS family permease
MSTDNTQNSLHIQWKLTSLFPLLMIVLVNYLIIGVAMPVVPLYVSHKLGFGTLMVGITVSCEFIAALISRIWSGHHADVNGAKRTVIIGLLAGAIAGALYFASIYFISSPNIAVTLLVLARTVLGVSESFVITGTLVWGLSMFGVTHAGKVIAWLGTALWGAYAAGAPLGTFLYGKYGFDSTAAVTVALPLLTLLAVLPMQGPASKKKSSSAFKDMAQVISSVWLPGVGLAFTAAGFGSITTFGALLFADKGWDSAWLVFTSLSGAFILGRLFFGHLPDKIGGAKVAMICVLIEAAGGFMIGLTPNPMLAFIGAAVTGLGYALVYPGFGLEAVRLAPVENPGLAMGTYTAFLDLALGITGPALGAVADATGLMSVFIVSGATVFCAFPIAVILLRKKTVI